MKTQTIKSIAARLAVAVTLSVSAYAGPDPANRFPLQTVSQPANKSNVTVALSVHSAVRKSEPAPVTGPKFVQAPAPHGGITFNYRGVSAETW